MSVSRDKIPKEIIPPVNRHLINGGYFTNDYPLKVITGEGGYFFQTDEHPIEMVLAGFGPDQVLYITVSKWIPGVKIRLQ